MSFYADNHRTKWVKLNGQLYKAPCAVVIGVEDDYPLFAEMDDALYVTEEKKVLASVNLLTATEFKTHFHCYIVERTSTYKMVALDTLFSPFPLHVRQLSSSAKLCIVVKHHIIGSLQQAY